MDDLSPRLTIESVFGVADERMIETIAPATRRRRLPKWPFIVIAIGVIAALLRFDGGLGFLAGYEPFIFGLSAIAAFFLAGRTEERIYQRFRESHGGTRMFVTFAVVALALVAVRFALALLNDEPADVIERVLWLFIAFGVWLGSAALGTVLILALDGAVRLTITDFRLRIIVGVLGLIVLAFVSSGLLVRAAAAWDPSAGLPKLFGFDLDRFPFMPESGLSPSVLAFTAFVVAGVAAMPAVVSVCAKLADTVMERITPLQRAFARVAEGDREVHVEEAGSPEFLSLAVSFNDMVDRLYLAERIERAFGQYVSAQVLDRIRAQKGSVKMPAQLRTASVFFADIRGFTPISERLPPQVVVDLLNRYLEQIVPVVEEHSGFLNKFVGDAVVVVFNAPIAQPAHAPRAVTCALAIQKLMQQLTAHGFFPECGEVHIGIGVATGPMLCSNIGTKSRLEYTVIGDTVNLAARMTAHAAPDEIWVSEASAVRLGKEYPAYPGEPIKFKGKDRAVVPYKVWPQPPS